MHKIIFKKRERLGYKVKELQQEWRWRYTESGKTVYYNSGFQLLKSISSLWKFSIFIFEGRFPQYIYLRSSELEPLGQDLVFFQRTLILKLCQGFQMFRVEHERWRILGRHSNFWILWLSELQAHSTELGNNNGFEGWVQFWTCWDVVVLWGAGYESKAWRRGQDCEFRYGDHWYLEGGYCNISKYRWPHIWGIWRIPWTV